MKDEQLSYSAPPRPIPLDEYPFCLPPAAADSIRMRHVYTKSKNLHRHKKYIHKLELATLGFQMQTIAHIYIKLEMYV